MKIKNLLTNHLVFGFNNGFQPTRKIKDNKTQKKHTRETATSFKSPKRILAPRQHFQQFLGNKLLF